MGEFAGAFIDASYSRTKPLSGPDADRRGYEYGGMIGRESRVWRTRGLYFCPMLEVRTGRRNSVFLAPPSPSSERTNDRFVTVGGAASPSSGLHGGVVISPTMGAWFARDNSAAESGATAAIRDYGFARFGVGLVILKRYTAAIAYERDFGTAAALPGFAVFRGSIDVGR